MDEFLEELIECIEYWCRLVQREDFRNRADVALVESFGETWGSHDPKITIEILTDFLVIEMLVAGLSVIHAELEVLPDELRVIARSIALATITARARNRCITDLVIFIERARENSYDAVYAFPPSEKANVAAQFVCAALCELFDQIEEDIPGDGPVRTTNTIPLSEFAAHYLGLLIGLPQAISGDSQHG
jgi:hypothetical protein